MTALGNPSQRLSSAQKYSPDGARCCVQPGGSSFEDLYVDLSILRSPSQYFYPIYPLIDPFFVEISHFLYVYTVRTACFAWFPWPGRRRGWKRVKPNPSELLIEIQSARITHQRHHCKNNRTHCYRQTEKHTTSQPRTGKLDIEEGRRDIVTLIQPPSCHEDTILE